MGNIVGGHASTGFGAKERAGDVCVITWLAGWSWGKDRERTEQAWGLKGQWKNKFSWVTYSLRRVVFQTPSRRIKSGIRG